MHVEIVENSRRRLHLALRASTPLYAFFGVMFIGLGLWCIRLLAVETRILVEQQRFSYTNTCLFIFDCGTVQAAAQDVRDVGLVLHARGPWRSQEVQVQLADGAYRLTLPQSGGDEKAAIARDIRAALSRPDASFRHAEGSPVAAALLGLVCIGGGLVICLAIQRVSLLADRDTGRLQLRRRLLLWPIERRVEIDLADLEAVQVVPHTLQTGRHIVTSYSIRLQTRGQHIGDSVCLTFLPMFTERAATSLAQIIRTWLRAG